MGNNMPVQNTIVVKELSNLFHWPMQENVEILL